jgi:integrase
MKLNDKTIRDLVCPIGRTEGVFFDDDMPGFGLRIRASGARSWLAQYAIGRRSRKVTLGSPPTVTAGTARAAAQKILSAARTGHDPAGEKAKAREQAASTVGALLPAFLERAAECLKPKTVSENRRNLMRYCRQLHGHPVAQVERRQIADLLDVIAREHGPVCSNKTRSALSSFFGWAARRGLLDASPVDNTQKAIANKPRERALTDAELALVYNAVGEIGSRDYADIVRLLALLGLRRGEVADMRWSEIDLAQATLTLPKERTKTGKEHVVPLSAQALGILKARVRIIGRDLVFGYGEVKGFDAFSASKRILDAKLGDAVAPWVIHDLRRTLSTGLNGAQFPTVQPHTVEALLGHTIPGIAGVYNRQQYEIERRDALALWGEHVERITGEAAIAKLQAAA